MKTFYSLFTEYANSFLKHEKEHDFHITLKKDHSIRVAAHSVSIAKTLSSDFMFIKRAELCGLFHDIARFEQFTQFNTFYDPESFDHGDYGHDLIYKLEILSNLSDNDKKLVAYVTKMHNKLAVPENNSVETLYTKIIRDADKLDIFFVMLQELENDSTAVKHSLPDEDYYSEEIIHSILANQQVCYTRRKTFNDFKLTMLGWINDLTFTFSYRYVLEHQYIEKMGSFLPNDALVTKLVRHIHNTAERRAHQEDKLESIIS